MTEPNVPVVPGNQQTPYTLSTLMPESVEPKRRKRWPWIVGSMAIILMVAGGAIAGYAAAMKSTPSAAPTTTPPPVTTPSTTPYVSPLTVAGVFYLRDDGFREGKDCEGTGGYSDIHIGTQVTITGPTGEVLALAGLIGGKGKKVGGKIVCAWFFFTPSVPAGKEFYGIEVSHRGVVRYSEADVQDEDLALSLGD